MMMNVVTYTALIVSWVNGMLGLDLWNHFWMEITRNSSRERNCILCVLANMVVVLASWWVGHHTQYKTNWLSHLAWPLPDFRPFRLFHCWNTRTTGTVQTIPIVQIVCKPPPSPLPLYHESPLYWKCPPLHLDRINVDHMVYTYIPTERLTQTRKRSNLTGHVEKVPALMVRSS